jgi:hypothetical protein
VPKEWKRGSGQLSLCDSPAREVMAQRPRPSPRQCCCFSVFQVSGATAGGSVVVVRVRTGWEGVREKIRQDGDRLHIHPVSYWDRMRMKVSPNNKAQRKPSHLTIITITAKIRKS